MNDKRGQDGPPDLGSPTPVRAGCGFVFGLFMAFAASASAGGVGVLDTNIAVGLVGGVVCAGLAVVYGDGFWGTISRWW